MGSTPNRDIVDQDRKNKGRKYILNMIVRWHQGVMAWSCVWRVGGERGMKGWRDGGCDVMYLQIKSFDFVRAGQSALNNSLVELMCVHPAPTGEGLRPT